MTLLEYYAANSQAIELFSDESSMFLIALVRSFKLSSTLELSRELGVTLEQARRLWRPVVEAGLGTDFHDSVQLTPRATTLLETTRLHLHQSQSKQIRRVPSITRAATRNKGPMKGYVDPRSVKDIPDANDKKGSEDIVSCGPKETGTVKWFNDAKGYGFISRQNGEDLFVHRSQIRDFSLTEGVRVEFHSYGGNKAVEARRVSIAPKKDS